MPKAMIALVLLKVLIPFQALALLAVKEPQSKVVCASFPILKNLIQEASGERFTVQTIVPKGKDPHSYQLTAKEWKDLKKCDLLVILGLDLEPWAKNLSLHFEENKILRLESLVIPIQVASWRDPHVWLSIEQLYRISDGLEIRLRNLSPQFSEIFKTRKLDFQNRLSQLKLKYQEQFKSIPRARRRVLVTHQAFLYLGKEFEIEFLAPTISSASMVGGANLGAKTISLFLSQAKKNEVHKYFSVVAQKNWLTAAMEKEHQLKHAGALYSDVIDEKDSSSVASKIDSVEKMIDYNLRLILESLI